MGALAISYIKWRQSLLSTITQSANFDTSNDPYKWLFLRAAAALIVGNIIKNFDEGVELALQTIKNEKSYKLLHNFVKESGNITKLREVEES